MGRPPRHADGAAGRRGDRGSGEHDRLHQHALADGDLVPGDARRAAGLGGEHRAASRLAGPEDARVGGGRAARRRAALRRRDVVPRPRRGFLAGRPGAADRQPEGRRAAAPARGPQRPSARRASRVTCVPTNALELLEVAAARDGMRVGRDRGAPSRRAPLDVLAQHLVTVALGGGFVADELLREVPQHARVRRAGGRRVGVGARLRDRGRRDAERLSRVRASSSVEDGVYVLTDARAGAPAPHVDRHDRERRADRRAVSARRRARLGGGVVRRAAEARGLASSSPARRWSSCACATCACGCGARRTRKGAIPRWMGSRLPLSDELAHLLRRRLEEAADGVFRGPELEALRPLLEIQRKWSAIPRSRRAAGRADEVARRLAPLLLSARGAARARGARGAVRVPDVAARADHLRDVVERLGDRAPLAERAAARRGARGRAPLAGAI